jgi:hypothetical protein
LVGLGARSSTIPPQDEHNEQEDVDIEGRDEDEVLLLPEPLKVAPHRLLDSGDKFELTGDVDAIIAIADTADMSVGRFNFLNFVLFLAVDRLQNVSRTKLSLLRYGDFNPCTPKEEVGLEGFINCTVCKMTDGNGAQYSLTIFVIANTCLQQKGYMKDMYLETIAEVMNSIRYNHQAFEGAEKRKNFKKMSGWPPIEIKKKGTNTTAKELSGNDGQSFFWVWTKMLEALLHDDESLPHPLWKDKAEDERIQRLEIVWHLRYHALYLVQSIGCKELYRIHRKKTLNLDSDIREESKQVLKEVFKLIPFVAENVSSRRCPILVDLAIDITPIGENKSFFFNGDRLSKWLTNKKNNRLDDGSEGDGSGININDSGGSEDNSSSSSDNSSSGSDDSISSSDNMPLSALVPNAGVRIFMVDEHKTYLDRDEEEDGANAIHEDNGEDDADDDNNDEDDNNDDSDDEDDCEAYDDIGCDEEEDGGDDDGNEDNNGGDEHNDDTIDVLGYGAKKGYTFPICATRRVLANGQLPGRTKFYVHYADNMTAEEDSDGAGQEQEQDVDYHVETVQTDTGEDILQDQQLTQPTQLTQAQPNSRARRAARRNRISNSTTEDGAGIVDDDRNGDTNDEVIQERNDDDRNGDTNDDVIQEEVFIELIPGVEGRVITTAVCYSPTYKASTLSQTRKMLQQTTENLPNLLNEIFSAIDELPRGAYELAKDAIENLQKMFEGLLLEFKATDNHWGRIEGTFLLDANEFPQVESVFDESMLGCISCVKTADIHAMTERIEQYYMKPLAKLLENMTEIVQAGERDEELKTKAFYQTYQGGVSTAVVEAAEIALCSMQVSKIGPLKGSILYESRKVEASECHIWTSFLCHRQALNQEQKCLTSLTYGLDPSAMPEKTIRAKDSRVTGVNKFQMQRLKRQMKHPDLYIWAMSRLSKAFSKLSKTALTSRLLINFDDMLLNGELSSQNVKAFQEEVASMLYTIHSTEMFRYVLHKIHKKRLGSPSDAERLPEDDQLPPMPRTRSDLLTWGRSTNNYVTLCNAYRGTIAFRNAGMVLDEPAEICHTMFGPENPTVDSGWCKSPSHIVYYKVIKKQLGKLETLWNEMSETHESDGQGNPFEMLEMQGHIARHAGIQGWVWLTTPGRQGRWVGAGVPVVDQNKDMGVVAEGMRNEHSLPPGAPAAPPRYQKPTDYFAFFFTIPRDGQGGPVLDMLVMRTLVNSYVEYIKKHKHCPTTTAQIEAANAVARKAFDQYFHMECFYTRKQWSNKLNGWGKKKIKVLRIFTECRSIEDVFKLSELSPQAQLLFEKVLHPLTADPSAKHNFELLQTAINESGALEKDFGEGRMDDCVWPIIESTTGEEQRKEGEWKEGEWKQEMEDLWTHTKLKYHVQCKMGALRLKWLSCCEKCTRASDDLEKRKELAAQIEKHYKIYVVDKRNTWGNEKKLLEYLFKETAANKSH